MRRLLSAALIGLASAALCGSGYAANQGPVPKESNRLAKAPVKALSEQLCGRTYTSMRQIYDEVSESKGVELLRHDDHYIAFRDDAAEVWWTFVKPGHAAGPAAVCRKLVEHRGQFYVHMEAMCHGPKKECDDLIEGFQKLLKTEK